MIQTFFFKIIFAMKNPRFAHLLLIMISIISYVCMSILFTPAARLVKYFPAGPAPFASVYLCQPKVP